MYQGGALLFTQMCAKQFRSISGTQPRQEKMKQNKFTQIEATGRKEENVHENFSSLFSK